MFGKMNILAAGLSLVFMLGALADRMSVLPGKDPGPYHASLRAEAACLPLRAGDWVGQNSDDHNEEAKSSLKPNVFISRSYTQESTGQHLDLLIVQCPDSRDLIPHYPSMCYPGRGLTQASAEPRDWVLDDALTITGTEYLFESNNLRKSSRLYVENFMVLPDGQISRDMDRVKAQVPLRNRFYGAAEFQVLFDDSTPPAERDEACRTILLSCKPLINAIRAGKPE